MSAYTDDEIDAVHQFAWDNRDGIPGTGSSNGARRLLDKIAPAIAARAWDEGYNAGWSDGGDANCAGLDPDDEHLNPYRATERT
jgi:hypothetical protein